jgi:hypothetical protein
VWARYRRVAPCAEDEERVGREGDELAQRLRDVIFEDWRRLLGVLLDDYAMLVARHSTGIMVHTVFERDVDAAEVDALPEIVLRDMRNNASRGIANKPRAQYALPPWECQAAESRCKSAACLEERELEHFRRQLVQLWTLGNHIAVD